VSRKGILIRNATGNQPALPLRPLHRQRRLDRAGRARAQPHPLDPADRTPRHHRPCRAHAAPPTPPRSRSSDPPRPRLDAAPPRPLALARRLHPRPEPHPRAPGRLTARAPHQSSAGRAPATPSRSALPANAPKRLPGSVKRPPRAEHTHTPTDRTPTPAAAPESPSSTPTDRWIRAQKSWSTPAGWGPGRRIVSPSESIRRMRLAASSTGTRETVGGRSIHRRRSPNRSRGTAGSSQVTERMWFAVSGPSGQC
jgi:hypothetical protein